MQPHTSRNNKDPFELLLANLKQEQSRIHSTESLLTDLTSMTYDEAQIRFRIEAAQKLAMALQKDRDTIIRQISQLLNVPIAELNLTALAILGPPRYRSRIYETKRELSRVIYQTRRSAGSAAILVNESLRIQQTVLSALMGISASDRYDASGSQPIDTGSTRMESRS